MGQDASSRLALVTGTSSGLGAAVASELLRRGWQVVGLARRDARERHPAYRHLHLDLRDHPALVATVNEHLAPRLRDGGWQRLGLVNNAGTIGKLVPLPHLDPEDVAEVYAVNAVAPIWLMGFFARHTAAGTGLRIVNVSSGVAHSPAPGLTAYNSSKAALRSAGMTLAAEWESAKRNAPAPPDAAILSYEPHVVDTEMQSAARSRPPEEFPWVDKFREYHRGGELVSPEGPAGEIADFLESGRQRRFAERRFRP